MAMRQVRNFLVCGCSSVVLAAIGCGESRPPAKPACDPGETGADCVVVEPTGVDDANDTGDNDTGDNGTGDNGTGDNGDGDSQPGAAVGLPFAVDDYFAPSGYMGDGEASGALTQDEDCPVRAGDQKGKCHRVTYFRGSNGWAGVYWLFPADNWGMEKGLPIKAGAQLVSFSAWSQEAGATVKFFAGGVAYDDQASSAHADQFKREQEFTLTAEPAKYELGLSPVTYESVVGGFGWAAAGLESGGPLVFYIDDIVWQGASQ